MRVMIMAQGRQERLAGAIDGPKQWVHLPYYASITHVGRFKGVMRAMGDFKGQEPILQRTLRQLMALGVTRATVVATDPLHQLLKPYVEAGLPSSVITLEQPGNNLIAGLRKVFVDQGTYQEPYCVLLGDVIYSWDTLRVLLRKQWPANVKDKYWPPVLFSGTPKVTASSGELWGCSWDADGLDAVLNGLRAIPDPPVETYQCGRLRKLLWEIQKYEVLPYDKVPDPFSACATGRWYHPTTDYTTDIDTPADLERLPAIGMAAYADDVAERIRRTA